MSDILPALRDFFGAIKPGDGILIVLGVMTVVAGIPVAVVLYRRDHPKTPTAPTPDNAMPKPLGAPKRLALAQYFAPERYVDNPLNVVLESYLALEAWFNDLFDDRNISYRHGADRLGPLEMAEVAVHHGLVHPQAIEEVRGLAFDRGLAIERRENVTPDQARAYANRVDDLIAALVHQVEAYEAARRNPRQ